MIGTTLSHYKVLEKIGQGGMGEVYRAEDTNLDREVAIKVLPEQFTQDPQRLARFEREAKLLAQLNHPNIAAIYGFEKAEGVHFLALELVPGETLAERVAKGPLPVEEALEVCRQIAEGVEAAHEKGVIHRDLKPSNVKVTPEGKVKILDFGLAKAFEEEVAEADISQSPTLTEEMTRAGVILGTAAYMSPEQAKGKPVDKRADVFAFGALLYELLTGKRAFQGESITETLGAIIHKEPEWDLLPGATPSLIRSLLRRCLQKDQDRRLRDIGDAKIEIEDALAEPTAASPTDVTSVVQPVQQRWTKAIALVVLGAVVAGLAVWLLIQPSTPEQRLNKFTITPSLDVRLATTSTNELAISPDGRHFAYKATGEGVERLYLKSLDDFVDKPIPGTEGVAASPFFSPDGESVAFFDGGSLKKVSLIGGSPITLCDAAGAGARTGTWGSDGTIVFSTSAGLYRVSSVGGEPELLAVPNSDQGEDRYFAPHILPDGENVLFSIRSPASTGYQIAVLSLETKEQKTLLANGRQAHYLPTGHLVYELSGTGNLMAVPFDLARLEVTGEPVPIVEGVRQARNNSVDYAVSEEGTLVYVPGQAGAERSLVWMDREGRETLVTEEKRDFGSPRISPDGKQLVLSIHQEGDSGHLWTYDLEDHSFSRLTFGGERYGSAVWSPDGKWIIFQSRNQDGSSLYRQLTDRSSPAEQLTERYPTAQQTTSWSPDGSVVTFFRTDQVDIWILPMDGDREPQPLINSPDVFECCGVFSPDGKWLAYVSEEAGIHQVYVTPYPEAQVKWLVSGEEGGDEPAWSPDGTELFYRSGDQMRAVSVELEPNFKAGNSRVLFEGSFKRALVPGFQYYDIAPDGQRFLMIKEDQTATTQINVVLNWFEELKRLVPTH